MVRSFESAPDEKINPLFVILAFGAGALLASMLLKKRDEKNKDKLEGYGNSNSNSKCELS